MNAKIIDSELKRTNENLKNKEKKQRKIIHHEGHEEKQTKGK